MNRTFKVVFNRARAGLMVANEITSSVQKKGTKTVVAVAALGLMAMFAQANASGYADAYWDGSSGTLASSYTGDFGQGKNWIAALCAKDGASGDLSNLTIEKTGDRTQQLFGLAVFDNANFNLTGESVTVNLSTGGLGGGDNALAGIYTQVNDKSNDSNTKVGISAKNVSVETTSTHSNGKSVYGVASYGGEVSFTGESVTLTTSTSTERKASDNQYSETAGLLVGTYGGSYGVGKVTFSDSTKLNVNVESKSSEATVFTKDEKSDRSGGSPAFGIKVDGGKLVAEGSTTLTVKSNGANATGLQLSAKNYQSTTGALQFQSTATINNLTAYATSKTGSAYGVRVQNPSGKDVKLTLSGDVSVSANASKDTKGSFANGVRQSGGTVILGSEGKSVTISANGFSDEDNGPTTKAVMLEKEGDLTIEGKTIAISSNGRGLQASEPSTMLVGNREKTELISIKSESMGVFALTGAEIGMQAQKISVVSNASGLGAIHTQNNTEESDPSGKVSVVTIKADNLEVTNTAEGGAGLSAFSNGKLDVDANLIIKATNALDVRGNSFVNINTSTQKTTKLDGDIVFETPWTATNSNSSGKLINSHVTVNLSGNDSYWNGRSYQKYNGTTSVDLESVTDYGAVTDFALTVSNGAQWTLSGDSFVNKLSLDNGGIVDATNAKKLNVGVSGNNEAGITVKGKGNKLTLGEKTAISGTIRIDNGSELITPLETAFTAIRDASDVVINGEKRLTIEGPKEPGGPKSGFATLTINDSFTLTTDAFNKFGRAYESVALNLANATLKRDQSEQPIDIPTDVALGAITDKKDVNVNGMQLTISGNGKESSIGTINLGNGNQLGIFAARNNTIVNVEKLTGHGHVDVGEPGGAGAKMFINNLAMDGGRIFVDPIHGHSVLGVNELGTDNTLTTQIIAGDGALVTIGTTSETEARASLAKVEGAGSARSVVFMIKAITIGQGGSFYIDPEATTTNINGQDYLVHVGVDGLLAVDQGAVGDSPVFGGAALVHFEGGKLAVVNAAPGTLTLVANSSQTPPTDVEHIPQNPAAPLPGLAAEAVLTDNPFVSVAEVSDTAVTLEASASQEGMSTLASMGIQSMIRRADMVLAETIADRMAGEVQTGSNLWVDVRGERYERDNLDNGAGFKADIGYGAFGAELAPTETTTLGVAFQYGNGTVKGDVANVKNKTKDYGFALYGSAMLGDTGVKGIGEVAYTKSTNDITSSLALMNQDTDATMLSAGVKAQKSFDLGTFEVIPSLGVRVSHIKTDAMQAGNVQIEKQKQTIVQIPLALRVNAKATETASGWSVTPKFKVAFIPTVGDKSIEVFGVKQSVIDTSPVQGSFGVGFAKGNLTIDAAAHLGAGNKGTSAVGGKVGLTYRF